MKPVWAGLLLLHSGAAALNAQGRALEASYGAWRSDTLAVIWGIGLRSPLPGPLDYGLAFVHLDDRRSPLNRTQSGGEFSLGTDRARTGPYAVAAVGVAMKHDDGNFDAFWSAGGGFTLRVFPFLALGIEGRYRTEDQLVRGFWTLDPSDRRGWLVSARAALSWNGGPGTRGAERPSRRSIARAARRHGVARSDLAAQIVFTALDAMGTPYRWGGEESNGYDCSGLIQFAYRSHGVAVPRVSREQAASGTAIGLEIGRLAPGDILGFSVEGDRVTHVGLYVGDGRFIHSASGGVKLSSLADTDPDSLWWRRRWAAARRILD
ncbi:MAG: C40 family peptidase [Gemmatimonadetes bacterium]|nr:C40 family peptidase [Gemmatimonadota bacterium]